MKLSIRLNEDGIPVLDQAQLEDFQDRIASVESAGSGDYSAIGPKTKSGDRAYGRYQVMGANIPSWTKQALGQSLTPQQFLASPEAQDAVFNTIFGGYAQKYGNTDDAASMWFSGKPLAEASGRRDILGTTPEQYVNKFNAAGVNPSPQFTSGPLAGVPNPSPVSPVGDVLPFARKNPGSMNLTEGARPRFGGFNSQWRDPAAVGQYETQVGLRPGSLKPVEPRSADVTSMQSARQARDPMEGVTIGPPSQSYQQRFQTTTAKPTAKPEWLYSAAANKMNLPNRIAKAVKSSPMAKATIQKWDEEMRALKTTDEQLQGMRMLAKWLSDMGF